MKQNDQLSFARLPRGQHRRHGAVLLYCVVLMTLFTAVATLAVDYGRVQLVKSEMQRTADTVARGYMELYNVYGKSYADAHVSSLYASAQNPVEKNSGITPTVNVQFGSWSSGAFSSSAGTTPAIKVTVVRTAANGNSVKLTWGMLIGVNSCDVHATAVAALTGSTSTAVSVSATADLYFAGMPATTTDTWGDNFASNAPYQVPSIAVVPGTYITFTNLGGTSSVVPGSVPNTGPSGSSTYVVAHGQNWDGTMMYPGSDNGIADAKMGEDTLVGLFLTNSAPNLTAAPSGQVDWTNSTQINQAVYSNIVTKQPFAIGSGTTSGGTVKQFLVPPGATRLYLGVWDGVDYANNAGTVTGTVTVNAHVKMMQ